MEKFLIKRFLIISFLFIFLSGFQVMAAPNSSLYFTPSNINIAPNQTFSLDSTLNPGTNQVTAVEIHVKFDPNGSKLNNITPSSTVFTQLLQGPAIDNVAGTGMIVVGIPVNGSAATGITKVATFSFSALSNTGIFTVSYTPTTIASAYNEPGNVITNLATGQITVTAPSLTPSPTNLPTPIPTLTSSLVPGPVSAQCGSFISSTNTIPILYSWKNGSGLQVWDSTGYWWYNSKAGSPFFLSSKDNSGIIPGIPVGRTVYSRTTYNWTSFSKTNRITCKAARR